jgi:hypothetical protein
VSSETAAKSTARSARLKGEHDLVLKSKLAAALASTGHYTRLDVKLAAEARTARGRPRAMELTDIDVLGLHFEADLTPSVVVGDCTTRASISPAARGFWLSGVMGFFGAQRAYLVLREEPDLHERQSIARLGIQVIGEDGLNRWLERLPEMSHSAADQLGIWSQREDALAQLSGSLGDLVEYRKYGFWQVDANQSLLQLVRIVRAHADALDPKHPHHRLLFLDLCALLSLSLLRFAHAVFHARSEELADASRSFIFGGSRSLRYREQLLERMRGLLNGGPAGGASMGEFALDPDYWPLLLDLIARLTARPLDSRRVPLEFASLMETGSDVTDSVTVARKLAWDVARFLVRAGHLPSSFELPFGSVVRVEQQRLTKREK